MSAQEYLETLAAEHQKRVDDYRALQEAKEQEQIEKIRQEYDIVYDKMPVELAEFYSFDPSDSETPFGPSDSEFPLKLSIPKHADIHVGYWDGALRYKCATNRASDGSLSAIIDLAKQYYHEWQPEPELEAETAPAPQPTDPSLLEQANMALESFNYQRAIALALVEVAHQLSEINKTLVSMHSL